MLRLHTEKFNQMHPIQQLLTQYNRWFFIILDIMEKFTIEFLLLKLHTRNYELMNFHKTLQINAKNWKLEQREDFFTTMWVCK